MTAKTVGEKIDRLIEARNEIRELNAEAARIEKETDSIKKDIIDHLDEQGIVSCSGKSGTVTLSIENYPSISDWNALCEFIEKNDCIYLLQRRLSVESTRELRRMGVTVPGVEFFRKVTLSTRAK